MHSGDNDFRGDSCRDGGHRIEISGRDRIPREMGFSGPIIKLVRRSIRHPAGLWQYVRAKPAYQLTYKPQPVGGVNQLSEPFNHCTPGRKQITASTDVDNSTKARKAGMLRTQIILPGNCLGFSLAIRQHQDRTNFHSRRQHQLQRRPDISDQRVNEFQPYLLLRNRSAVRGSPRNTAGASCMD